MKEIITILCLLIGLVTFAQAPLVSLNQRYLIENEEVATSSDTITYTINNEHTVLSVYRSSEDVMEFKVLKEEDVEGVRKFFTKNTGGYLVIFSLLHDVDGIYGMIINMVDSDNRWIEIQNTINIIL